MINRENRTRFLETERDRTVQLIISNISLDFRYGKTKLFEHTSRQCVFTITEVKFLGYYRCKNGFYGLADRATIFQEKKLTKHWNTVLQRG